MKITRIVIVVFLTFILTHLQGQSLDSTSKFSASIGMGVANSPSYQAGFYTFVELDKRVYSNVSLFFRLGTARLHGDVLTRKEFVVQNDGVSKYVRRNTQEIYKYHINEFSLGAKYKTPYYITLLLAPKYTHIYGTSTNVSESEYMFNLGSSSSGEGSSDLTGIRRSNFSVCGGIEVNPSKWLAVGYTYEHSFSDYSSNNTYGNTKNQLNRNALYLLLTYNF
jgi:hypothetical protein